MRRYLNENDDFVTLYFGKLRNWLFRNGIIAKSVRDDKLYDHFDDSQKMLQEFKAANEEKINGMDLKTHQVRPEMGKGPVGRWGGSFGNFYGGGGWGWGVVKKISIIFFPFYKILANFSAIFIISSFQFEIFMGVPHLKFL